MDDVEVLSALLAENEFTPHYHESYAFGAILSGRCRFHSRGRSYIAEAGDVFVIESYAVHSASCPDGLDYRVIYCSAERLGRVAGLGTDSSGLAFPDTVYPGHVASVAALGRAMAEATNWCDRGSLEPVIGTFARAYGQPRSAPMPAAILGHVARALDLIDERIAGSVRLWEIASELGITQCYFNRLFQRTLGLPPNAYVRQRRLEVAKRFLRSGAALADAAAGAGFADQSHMTREFRRIQGITPGAVARSRPADTC